MRFARRMTLTTRRSPKAKSCPLGKPGEMFTANGQMSQLSRGERPLKRESRKKACESGEMIYGLGQMYFVAGGAPFEFKTLVSQSLPLRAGGAPVETLVSQNASTEETETVLFFVRGSAL